MKHVETFKGFSIRPLLILAKNIVCIKNINFSGKYTRNTFIMLIKIEYRVYQSTQCLCERFAIPHWDYPHILWGNYFLLFVYFLIWIHYVMAGIFIFI